MRRGRRGTEDSVDLVEEKEPEFARVKLKKTGSTYSSNRSIEEVSTDATNELRQKLERQKSVADGIGKFIFCFSVNILVILFYFPELLIL
jgi:hypothetical protein